MASAKPKKIPENERHCSVCGKPFYAFPYKKTATCNDKGCRTIAKSKNATKHGASRSRLYNIWCGMKSRCNGTGAGWRGIEYYHSRGITVCDEWLEFTTFQDWALANGYEEGLEIDRRDSNGNYEPDNCRWATRKQQLQNTSKRSDAKTSRFKGVSKHSQNKSWVAQGHRDGRPVNIGSYKTEAEAAHAYDAWARVHYGEFSSLNFSDTSQGGVSR